MLDRLKYLRMFLNLNQTEFAKHLGLTQPAYSAIENGTNPFLDRHIKIICYSFNVNEEWLRNGEGDIFSSSPYENEFRDLFSKLTPDTQQYLLIMARGLLDLQEKLLHTNEADTEPSESTCEDAPSEAEPE